MFKRHLSHPGIWHLKLSPDKPAFSPSHLLLVYFQKNPAVPVLVSHLHYINVDAFPHHNKLPPIPAGFTPKFVFVLTPERDTLECCNTVREAHPKIQIQTHR